MVKISPKRYSIGCDLGQAADPTAIAICEKKTVPPDTAMFSPVGVEPGNRLVEGDEVFDLIYLKRPKLGTPYDIIAQRVADLACKVEPKGAFGEYGYVTLSVDGTGVGRGIVDMLHREFGTREARNEYVPRLDFRPITITGSESTLKRPKSRREYWRLPKKELMGNAVVQFQQKRLRISSAVADKDVLVEELRNYSRKVNIATGNTVFEPWRETQHDDLLFATALSLWGFTQKAPQFALRVAS